MELKQTVNLRDGHGDSELFEALHQLPLCEVLSV